MFEFLHPKRVVPFVMKLSDDIFHAPRWRKLESALASASQGRHDFFFVQIGANDGITHDRLHRFITAGGWSGILVEPVPYYFGKLQAAYAGHPGLVLENVAVSANAATQDIYRIREGVDHLPGWVNGMASLHLDVLMNHKWAIPNIEDYIVKESIQCLPLHELLARNRVNHIDLLAIDTEGHDFEVIRQVDFKHMRPGIVTYEHKHLTKMDRKACEALLRENGYSISRQLGNTLALTPGIDGWASHNI